jgi:hypothetical protein
MAWLPATKGCGAAVVKESLSCSKKTSVGVLSYESLCYFVLCPSSFAKPKLP